MCLKDKNQASAGDGNQTSSFFYKVASTAPCHKGNVGEGLPLLQKSPIII